MIQTRRQFPVLGGDAIQTMSLVFLYCPEWGTYLCAKKKNHF